MMRFIAPTDKMPTLKEGQMYKRGKVNPDWKQRTFVLDDKRLCYFKGGKATPAGFINLGDVIEVSPFLDEGVFQVSTPTRVYEFRGSTRAEGLDWRQAIIDACHKAGNSIRF